MHDTRLSVGEALARVLLGGERVVVEVESVVGVGVMVVDGRGRRAMPVRAVLNGIA
jgi:hypothetical protein